MGSRALSGGGAVDGVVVSVLLSVGLAGFWPVFGGPGFLRPALVGLAAGAGIALLGAWLRWNALLVTLGFALAYLAFGTAAALPEDAILGVVPTVDTLVDLVFGAVEVWRQFVTATTPVDAFPGFGLAPFFLALLGAVTALSAAWRARRPALALVPVAAVLVAVIALGTAEFWQPVAQGGLVVAVSLPWLAWRSRAAQAPLITSDQAALARRRLRDSVIVLGAAALAMGVTGTAVGASLDREVVRDHVEPPLDLRAYASPLTSFRAYVETRGEEALFSIDGWQADYRLRLAVLDAFDGMVYNVGAATGANRYDRVGPRLAAVDQAEHAEIKVTVEGYSGVWLPGLNQPEMVEFGGSRAKELTEELYFNPVAGALVNPVGLATGDSYLLRTGASSVSAGDVADAAFAQVSLPAPQEVPEALADLGSKLVGNTQKPAEQVSNITSGLATSGYFSHGLAGEEPSTPGHSSARIASLLENPDRMVGDDEQYAVAAALMLRQLGVPARVVMGFKVDAKSEFSGQTWTVKGSDVHAWVEVPFEGYGWVPFDATPNEDQKPTAEQPKSRSDPKPQILQPPPMPTDPESDEPDTVRDDERSEDDEDVQGIDWALVAMVCGAVVGCLAVVLGPAIAVLLLKRRRSLRRRTAADLSARVAGGWQEIMDALADLGTALPPAATRRQAAAVVRQRYPVEELDWLAQAADYSVFARPATPESFAAEYWAHAAETIRTLGRSVSGPRRWRARLAVTSLRKQVVPTVRVEELP